MTYFGTKSGEAVKRTREAIAERMPFEAGGYFPHVGMKSMSGFKEFRDYGVLPGEWRDQLQADSPTYLVYSYATPIAWYSEERGWTIPKHSYSSSTDNHQSQVRQSVFEYTEELGR